MGSALLFVQLGPRASERRPMSVVYGPSTCGASSCQSAPGVTPTYLGPGTNPNMGTGAQATGNIGGWAGFNPDMAILTGIVLPQGIRDPYVYNDFLSIQREIAPKTCAGSRLCRHHLPQTVPRSGYKPASRRAAARLPVGQPRYRQFGPNL